MSALKILYGLLKLAAPMAGWMCLAILLGVAGFVAASAIPALAAWTLGQSAYSFGMLAAILMVCAVSRGLLRYGEQACNHYIAFKLLAAIRDKVFGALRRLAPAKLDTRAKGDLIETITRDVELLEVFYAHTISPVCIALICTALFTAAGFHIHPAVGLTALTAYAAAAILPILFLSKKARQAGTGLRRKSAALSAFVLEQAAGLFDLLQFGQAAKQRMRLDEMTDALWEEEKRMRQYASDTSSLVNGVIVASGLVMILVCAHLSLPVSQFALAVTGLLSTFGPVTALANLSTGLAPTLAAGARVLSLLEEKPLTTEIHNEKSAAMGDFTLDGVTFGYDEKPVLKNLDLDIAREGILALSGPSGQGKSTLLRLLMRFYDPDQGQVRLQSDSLSGVDTSSLRALQGVVLQDTFLFADNVENNLRIARPDATQEELEQACRQAAIHDFIMSLPQGYATQITDASLSAGERQRLGLARAFVHKSRILLLDEPTSNLDVLNEGAILRSIARHAKDRMVVLVSHRPGAAALADRHITMKGAIHEY